MKSLIRWIQTPLPYKTYRHSAIFIFICITGVVFLIQRFFPYIQVYIFLNAQLVIKKGYVWSIITYMFAHGGISHILFNMLGLYFFGSPLERMWGSNEFIFMYLLFGIVSGIVSLIVYAMFGAWGVFLLGASGAVFGVMLVFSCMYPHARIYIFGIFPVTARVLMIIYIVLQFVSLSGRTGSGVAYLTHLGGIAIAWIYMIVRHKIDPYTRLFRKY